MEQIFDEYDYSVSDFSNESECEADDAYDYDDFDYCDREVWVDEPRFRVLHSTITYNAGYDKNELCDSNYGKELRDRPTAAPNIHTRNQSHNCPLCLEASRLDYLHHIGDCPYLPIHEKRIISRARSAANILGYANDLTTHIDSSVESDYPDAGHNDGFYCNHNHVSPAVDHSHGDPSFLGHDDDSVLESTSQKESPGSHVRYSEPYVTHNITKPHRCVASASVVPNQDSIPFVELFHGNKCVRMQLASGSSENLIDQSLVHSLGAVITNTLRLTYPTDKASDRVIVGETSLTFSRDGQQYLFEGFVVKSLDCAIKAGIPFLELHDVFIRPAKRSVTFGSGPTYFYGPSSGLPSVYTHGSCLPTPPTVQVDQPDLRASSSTANLDSVGVASLDQLPAGEVSGDYITSQRPPSADTSPSHQPMIPQQDEVLDPCPREPPHNDDQTSRPADTTLGLQPMIPQQDVVLGPCPREPPHDDGKASSSSSDVDSTPQVVCDDSVSDAHVTGCSPNTYPTPQLTKVSDRCTWSSDTSPRHSREPYHPYSLLIIVPPGRPPDSDHDVLATMEIISSCCKPVSSSRLDFLHGSLCDTSARSSATAPQSCSCLPMCEHKGLPPGRPPDSDCIVKRTLH